MTAIAWIYIGMMIGVPIGMLITAFMTGASSQSTSTVKQEDINA